MFPDDGLVVLFAMTCPSLTACPADPATEWRTVIAPHFGGLPEIGAMSVQPTFPAILPRTFPARHASGATEGFVLSYASHAPILRLEE